MDEIHLTKKDFKIDWFSGQGAGGQHRNKHQNCCRITHVSTGITCTGQNSRSRIENQREAFNALAKLVIKFYNNTGDTERARATEVIRNYHAPRNEVHDKASGLRRPYKDVVLAGNLVEMVDARRRVMGGEDGK